MSREDLDRLLSEAEDLDCSPTKVAILEEAVRIADALRDVGKGYQVREELIRAATFSDLEDRAIVAFAWCLAQSDKNPDRFPEKELLWSYNHWILNGITDFPNISLDRIRELQEDYERRLRRQGYGMKSYYFLRMNNAIEMGFIKESDGFEKLWLKAKSDEMTPCKACQLDRVVTQHVFEGRYAQAIDAAGRILSGKLSCNRISLSDVYEDLLTAYWGVGDRTKAEEIFSRGYRLVAGDRDCLRSVSGYLNHLVRIFDIHRGMNLIERHLPWVSCLNNLDDRAIIFSRIANFFERLAAERPQSRRIRIPQTMPIYNDDGHYDPAVIAAWFREQSEKIAAQFDARNSNNYSSWSLASMRAEVLGLKCPEYEEPKSAELATSRRTKEPGRRGRAGKTTKSTQTKSQP
ncbi:MAG: hypothetical protein ACKVP0_09040 [Pirellulaceae bacterium]